MALLNKQAKLERRLAWEKVKHEVLAKAKEREMRKQAAIKKLREDRATARRLEKKRRREKPDWSNNYSMGRNA